MSVDLLRKGLDAIWVGSPGIGKSCDMNHIFIELLRHLGEDGWPRQVAFRQDCFLFTFTESNVTLSRFYYSDLQYYTAMHEYDNSVLILELQGNEKDPGISMPFIMAIGSRDIKSTLKSTLQDSVDGLMLISPPDIEEVSLMTEAIMNIYPNNDIFNGKSKDEAVDIVRTRAQKIGAIPRYIFNSERKFESRLHDMRTSATAKLSYAFEELSVDNIPKEAEVFAAPYFRPGVTDPSLYVRYKKAAPDFLVTSPEECCDVLVTLDSLYSYESRYLSDDAK